MSIAISLVNWLIKASPCRIPEAQLLILQRKLLEKCPGATLSISSDHVRWDGNSKLLGDMHKSIKQPSQILQNIRIHKTCLKQLSAIFQSSALGDDDIIRCRGGISSLGSDKPWTARHFNLGKPCATWGNRGQCEYLAVSPSTLKKDIERQIKDCKRATA